MVPFHDVPKLPARSLVLSGQWEPGPIKALAQQLVTSASDSSSKYEMIPYTTHVSILFSAETFAQMRSWTAQLLATKTDAPFPKNMPALACLLGLLGLSMLTPPFLREMTPVVQASPASPAPSVSAWLGLGLIAFFVARLAVPFTLLHLFQGDYLASFLFLVGILVLLPLGRRLPKLRTFFSSPCFSAAASALLLSILFAAWFELTFYEAWPTAVRSFRLPLLFLCFLPWHLAEEIFLGEVTSSPSFSRIARALALRAVLWAAILIGVLYMHTGEILFFLLAAYFAVFFLLQRLACDLVRFRTRSPAAAAIFGAILLAAFALAIFPVA